MPKVLTTAAALHRLMHLVANDGTVSEVPIYVRVVRPTGVSLTMCDLPGITAMSAVSIAHAQTRCHTPRSDDAARSGDMFLV